MEDLTKEQFIAEAKKKGFTEGCSFKDNFHGYTVLGGWTWDDMEVQGDCLSTISNTADCASKPNDTRHSYKNYAWICAFGEWSEPIKTQ